MTGARRLRRAGRFFSTPSRFVTSRDARNARGGNDEGSSDESLGDEATRRVSDPSDDSIGDPARVEASTPSPPPRPRERTPRVSPTSGTDSDVRTPRRERFRGASSPRSLSRVRTRRGQRGSEPNLVIARVARAQLLPSRPPPCSRTTPTSSPSMSRTGPRRLRGAGPRDRRGVGRRRAARAAGLPRFSAVPCWAHALLETCAARRVCSSAAKRTAIAKLADARQAAGRVSTYLMSQLPYTYVNLGRSSCTCTSSCWRRGSGSYCTPG